MDTETTTPAHTPTPKDIIKEAGWLHNEDTGRIPQRVVVSLMEKYESSTHTSIVKRIAELQEALHKIRYAAEPENEMQKDSWINTAREIADEALSK